MADLTVADLAKDNLRQRIAEILKNTRDATREATGLPTAVGASPLPVPVIKEEEETA